MVGHASLEEISNQKIRTNEDGKKLFWKMLIAVLITIFSNIVCNLRIIPFFCEFRTVLSMIALVLLIMISRNWANTRKLFHDFLHPIVPIGVLVPSVIIMLMLYSREGLNAIVELLLLLWFTFFILANVNFKNLATRVPISQGSTPENYEFRRLYSQVLNIYGDLVFGVFLIIFILAFLIASSGEDLLISWLIISVRKSNLKMSHTNSQKL